MNPFSSKRAAKIFFIFHSTMDVNDQIKIFYHYPLFYYNIMYLYPLFLYKKGLFQFSTFSHRKS